MIQPLSPVELDQAVAGLSGWHIDPARNALHRQLRFPTFGAALAAMVRIGVEADKADHHPEWTNVYDRLDIWLVTHDAGGISTRDIALAKAIDAMFPPAEPVVD